jgi:hypothetical protein
MFIVTTLKTHEMKENVLIFPEDSRRTKPHMIWHHSAHLKTKGQSHHICVMNLGITLRGCNNTVTSFDREGYAVKHLKTVKK